MQVTRFRFIALAIACVAILACSVQRSPQQPATPHLQRGDFGITPAGARIQLFTLTNAHGVELKLMSYGAAVVSLKTPDKDGRLAEVVAGFDELPAYTNGVPYF